MVRYNKANEIPMLKVPMQIIQCSTGTNPIYICHISKNITFYGKSGASDSGLHLECSTPSASLPLLFWVFPATSLPCSRTRVGSPLVHSPHTEHHDDADNTIQEIKRKHHHDVQCGGHVRGGDLTRVREHGDDVAGNTQNSNDGEADSVEHSK
nr:hypothetical protein Iba_chr01bCG7200 [Ipomoea batatas]